MFSEHAIGGAMRFEPGDGGLTRAVIDTDACRGAMYLHGAHVTRWKPAGTDEVLFVSKQADFAEGRAIRGGVPVCFPWFGPHPSDPTAPAHGLARTIPWELQRTVQDGDNVALELTTTLGPLHAHYRASFGHTLTLSLTAANRGPETQTITEALHTYLAVADARHVHVTGLGGATYQDKTRDNQRFIQDEPDLRLLGETDRVYLDTDATCVLHDPGRQRRIIVAKQGSRSTVIWNIGPEKVTNMNDMADDEWPRYCCIETANALDNVVTLEPGTSHTLTQIIRVEAL